MRDCEHESERAAFADTAGAREGTVIARSQREYEVDRAGSAVRCTLRGRLHGEGVTPIVGDRVVFQDVGPSQGVIEEIRPRRNVLARSAGGRKHLYCANVDTVVIVCAAHEPPIRPALIDRLLITAQAERIDAVICLNKIDLDTDGEVVRILRVYRDIGYEVFFTSAETGDGVRELGDRLSKGVSVFSGHSGVGKTSLLKQLIPGFEGKTLEVTKWARGRHSTTEVYIVGLPGGGYVVDTPGFREFTVWGVAPADIGSYYPEFLPFASKCKYNNCLHYTEPDCAVKVALEEGHITELRYTNYVRLLEKHGLL
jgi:ribosome biogenesis GTPase / thiamine phosphate phosphatase